LMSNEITMEKQEQEKKPKKYCIQNRLSHWKW
jgi:hypothetical protein